MKNKHSRGLLLASITLLTATTARAAEWHHSASVPVTVQNDSNLALSSTDEKGVTRAITTPTYNATGSYGVDEFKAGLALNVERSSDTAISQDREDPKLLFGWRHATETGEFGLTTNYAQASTQQSQLQQTGLRVRDSTQTTWSLGGNWLAAISERSTLSANVDYVNVSYDAGLLTNYENFSTGVNWSYAWSEKVQPFVQLTASHYQPERDIVPSSDFYQVQGGVKVKLAENWDWSAQAGMGRVVANASDNGWLGSATLTYTGPRYDLTANAGRSVTASGEGGFVESDQIKGAWSYALDELSRLGLSASWQDNKGLQPNTMNEVGAWVGHEISPFWNARLSYQYKQRVQDGQPDATASIFGVTLVYSHPDF